MAAVAEGKQGDLLALEQLLDHDRAAERGSSLHARVDLLGGAADEDALARGEAVGLDDTRGGGNRERCRRPDAGRGHHLLGEALRALDAGRLGPGPEDGDAVVAQLVGDAGDERALRPDHDEVGVEGRRKAEEAVTVVGTNRMALAERGDAGVAGGGVEVGQRGARRQAPGERVLAGARADKKHLHFDRVYFCGPRQTARGSARRSRGRSDEDALAGGADADELDRDPELALDEVDVAAGGVG